jgi:DNA-binding CsgD family transcriptional regulator
LAEAAAWLRANDRWLSWSTCLPGVADGKLAWARYHRRRGDLAAASECAAAALEIATTPRQPLALLRAHRTAGELALDRGNSARAGTHLQQAADLAERCHAPYEHALAMLALGQWHIAEGRPAQAAGTLDQARTVLAELEAVPALRRLDAMLPTVQAAAPALPFGLTTREAEVLRLMAQGLTDAAVAERLFISPRTVSTHLRSVYAKLQVSSRAAATRFALEHGLA